LAEEWSDVHGLMVVYRNDTVQPRNDVPCSPMRHVKIYSNVIYNNLDIYILT